jgi:hypothetical protein
MRLNANLPLFIRPVCASRGLRSPDFIRIILPVIRGAAISFA